MQSDTNNADTKYDRYINIQNTADKKKIIYDQIELQQTQTYKIKQTKDAIWSLVAKTYEIED